VHRFGADFVKWKNGSQRLSSKVATSPWVGCRPMIDGTVNPLQLKDLLRDAFNIPVSEAKDDIGFLSMPNDLERLKAEYFEWTDGRGRGTCRGSECRRYVFPG
jgi:hypothetical protein